MADKEKKPNQFELVGKKIVKFFIELKSELKKVVWPDRKKLTQSTITVVMICLFAAVLIFSVDKILSGVLGAIGFYPKTSSSVTSTEPNLLPTTAISKPTSSVQTSSKAVSSSVSSAVSSTAASSTAASSTVSAN